MSAGAEAGRIGGEEVDHFGYLFGVTSRATGVEGVFFSPIIFDAAIVHLGELLEEVIDQRCADGSGTDGVDADALWAEVDGEAAGDLPQCAFGESVGEAVGLADEPLVGSVDDDAATTGVDEVGDGFAQGVDGAVDVGLYHEVEFFVGDVEQGVATVDAGVCHYAVQLAEAGDGGFHSLADVGTGAGVAFDKEQAVGFTDAALQLLGGEGVDVHKADVPAFVDELHDGSGSNAGGAAGDKQGFHIRGMFYWVTVYSL